jgi:hypothetical protein
MTGTNCDLFTNKQSRSYLNHLVHTYIHVYTYIHTYIHMCVTFSQFCIRLKFIINISMEEHKSTLVSSFLLEGDRIFFSNRIT